MAKGKKKKSDDRPKERRYTNRKARHEYHVIEKVECGIELAGTEVKSLRDGQVKLDEGYARIQDGEVYLLGVNIAQYSNAAGTLQHEPTRDRKLLVHRRQIEQLATHVKQKGRTLVPLAIYFRRGWAKCELGVVEGKRRYDKREAIKRRDQQRDMERAMARHRR